MKDGKPIASEDGRRGPAGRPGGAARRQRSLADRAGANEIEGHSGHGADSVRPYLREQLRMKSLLPAPFPMPETQARRRDDS